MKNITTFIRMSYFLSNLLRTAIYWAIFYVALIPFLEFTWKTLAGSFILGFFAAMINQLITQTKAPMVKVSDMPSYKDMGKIFEDLITGPIELGIRPSPIKKDDHVG